MTSNIGAAEIARNTPLGFAVSEDDTCITYDDMKNRIMGELKKVFRPEFLYRIDDVIVFDKLQKDEIGQIVELLLLRIRESMADRELQLELTDPTKEMLVEKGWDPAMVLVLCAAPSSVIEDPLADFVLREKVIPGATVVVNPANEGEEGEVRLTVVKPKKQKTPVGVGAEGAVAELPRAGTCPKILATSRICLSCPRATATGSAADKGPPPTSPEAAALSAR